jgi:hypothetical protein
MQRPDVRIIDTQKEEIKSVNISQSEADALLAKYGYKQSFSTTSNPTAKSNPLTFEEMVKQQENEKRRIEQERINRSMGPKPVSFDGRNVTYSEVKYSNLEVDDTNSLGIKIQIVTDMKIN